MYDVFYIAKWFLNRDRITNILEDSDGISNLKLQKLLYYAQGTFLAVKGEKLFPDDLLAWTHGPVVERVYHAFKEHGSGPIPFDETFDPSRLNKTDSDLLGFETVAHNYFRHRVTIEGEPLSDDTKLYVLRFNRQGSRIVCHKSQDIPNLFYIVSFDFDHSAYNHG